MELHFDDERLGCKCNSFRKLVTNYGPHLAGRIRQRLDELQAASNLAEFLRLPSIRYFEITDHGQTCLAVVITPPFCLIIMPFGRDTASQNQASLSRQHVVSVLVITIEENG